MPEPVEFDESKLDLSGLDFSDLESQYHVEEPVHNYDQFVICDGAPVAPEAKAPVLKKVLTKLFSQCGKVVDMFMPLENGQTKGYLIIEMENAAAADKAVKQLNGKKLDVKHRLLVNKLPDMEKYALNDKISEEFVEPPVPEFQSHGYLHSWLLDPNGREQFVVHHHDTVGVCWYKKNLQPEDVIESRAHWTSASMRFSPKGTYLFSFFPGGVQAWGGEKFDRIRRFVHPGVQLLDFSPTEKFLVTLSPEPISIPPEDHPARAQCLFSADSVGHKLVIWDLQTGLPVRTFALPPNLEKQQSMPWPLIKWSYNDKYCARMGPDALAIYDTTDDFALLDKKLYKVEGIADFEFAPAGVRLATTRRNDEPETVLSYWTPETVNQSARVSVVQLPSKQVLRTVNLFNVSDVKMSWHNAGKFLCCKVDRHTKSKKTTFTNLELLSLSEKDIPVEKIELKEVVSAFQWEPHGERFVTVSKLDIPNPNIAIPDNIVSFYDVEEAKGSKQAVLKKWVCLKQVTKTHANQILWSPKGRFVAVGTVNGTNGEIDFYDMDYDGEKEKDQTAKVASNLKLLNHHEFKGLTGLEWDASGRYLAGWSSAWRHKIENGYKIFDLVGNLCKEELIDGFREFEWRPRPASILSANDRKKVRKNLKEYAAQFEEADAMEADAELRELILKRKKLLTEWYTWRSSVIAKLKELNLTEQQHETREEVIEEVKEEILEETEEVVDRCCLIMDRPLNFALSTLMANIDPHPSEMSLTDKLDGSRASFSLFSLVLRRWNSNTERVTGVRPSGLSTHHSLLTVTGAPDSLHLQQQPVTSSIRVDGSVPVSVGTEGNVVGVLTEVWVGNDGNVGIDGNKGTREARAGKSRLGLADVVLDVRRSSSASVDELVTNGDGVNVVPGTVFLNSVLDLGNTVSNGVDVVDTQEEFLVVTLGLQNVFDLVTVDTVKSDQTVVRELFQVTLDLGQGLTSTGGRVRRVSDTLGATGEVASRGWLGSRRAGAGSGGLRRGGLCAGGGGRSV
ncbi:hypothetical protein OGAPHI_000594 [Ogataea philodendri]|uniref:Eukaryotic translation initiation factor 3 subunit B n=1 Tax=Ogataea philodendri TaxID=1378263 RepID=A0A9P8PEP5_9ASCO|nr:uncharacterized protein OGAPHI_000594 [Ogataea philodendri]KAH3670883.1 hypothetical protein OGAPHI_000594 [Ogataea philodendri]